MGVPSSVSAVSFSATGGSLTLLTVTVISASLDVAPSLSATV